MCNINKGIEIKKKKKHNMEKKPKEFMPIIGTNFFLSPDDENVIKVFERYGNTHKIEAVIGTEVNMVYLEDNQDVCWGDGQSYQFRLTKI